VLKEDHFNLLENGKTLSFEKILSILLIKNLIKVLPPKYCSVYSAPQLLLAFIRGAGLGDVQY